MRDKGATGMGSTTRLLHRAWRVLGSVRLAAILLAALLLATLVASLFPQMPSDPIGREPWLSAVALRYHHATGLLFSLGLFKIYYTPWYVALLAGLLASTVACTLQRLPRLWQSLIRPPAVAHPDAFYRAVAQRIEWPLASLEAGLAAAQSVLSRHGYQVCTKQEEAGRCAHVQGERGRWAQAGTLLSHISALFLILAVTARPALSRQMANLTLLPGQRQTLDLPPPLTVEAGLPVLARYTNGQPRDVQVPLTVLEQGVPVVSQTVRINHPLTYQGTALRLQAYGPAVQVSAPEGTFDLALEHSQVATVSLPEAGLTLRVAPSSTEGPLFVEALATDGTFLGSGTVGDGATIDIEGTPISFFLSHYTVWEVDRDPTFVVAIAAAGGLLTGIVVSLWVPHRRIWLRVDGQKVQMVAMGDLTDLEAMASEMARASTGIPGSRE